MCSEVYFVYREITKAIEKNSSIINIFILSDLFSSSDRFDVSIIFGIKLDMNWI